MRRQIPTLAIFDICILISAFDKMVSFQCSCMENVIFFSLLPVCAVHCLSAALLYTSEQRCKLKETDQRQTVV